MGVSFAQHIALYVIQLVCKDIAGVGYDFEIDVWIDNFLMFFSFFQKDRG